MITAAINIPQRLDKMAHDIRRNLADKHPLIIGIHTGGVWVAEALIEKLGNDFSDAPLGTLNISFYRDDFSRTGLHPHVAPSTLPFSVEDRHLLLVDDVIHSGRTIRAALNELFDYGRPASVTLAVLVARTGRELPFQADIVGEQCTLPADQNIKLTRDDNAEMTLEIVPLSSGAAHVE